MTCSFRFLTQLVSLLTFLLGSFNLLIGSGEIEAHVDQHAIDGRLRARWARRGHFVDQFSSARLCCFDHLPLIHHVHQLKPEMICACLEFRIA